MRGPFVPHDASSFCDTGESRLKEKRASGVVIGDDVSGTARPTGREPLTARKHLVSFVLHPHFDMKDLRLPMSIFEAANRLAG